MEKIDIREFSKKVIDRFSVLTKKYNFKISEIKEKSKKKENSTIHKIIFKNTETKRIVEFVLIVEDYKTHMFCRIIETYVKRINENGEIPNYNDFENCYQIEDLDELIDEKYNYSEILNYTENYINKVQNILYHLRNIFICNYWPTITEIEDKQKKRIGFTSVGHRNLPYINIIKNELKEIENLGYEIVFDETQIPPYEQSFMSPSIKYYNKKINLNIEITFQTRDQEFYVSRNNKGYFYGKSTVEEYTKLKKKLMLNK